jgi:hypothetical protein
MYVPPVSEFKNSTLRPANEFIWFVEQTVIISLNNIGKNAVNLKEARGGTATYSCWTKNSTNVRLIKLTLALL